MSVQLRDVRFSEIVQWEPKQAYATQQADIHQYTLFGGARGPGKSYWLRWYLMRALLRFAAAGLINVVVGLFCENYPQLTDRQIGKIKAEFPSWLGTLKTTRENGLGFYLRPCFGSGILKLRNLDDASKYQSSEFAGIGVDELTKNKVRIFNELRGSLRWPGVPKPRFVAGTNPGGVGHVWVNAYWREANFPKELEALAHEFVFVPALPDDNSHLTPEYWALLESLPEDLAKAWRWGQWDVFAGQFFAGWRAAKHVIEPFDVPAEWPLYGSVDYGFNARTDEEKPFVYGLYATDTSLPTPHAYRIDEVCGAEWDVQKQKVEIQILEARYSKRPVYRVGCPSMFTSQQHHGPTISEMYADKHIGDCSLPVTRGDYDRVNGWARCRQWLTMAPDGLPYFMSFARCRHFNDQVPAVTYNEVHPDDIDPDAEAHAIEEWRHFLMSRPSPARVVEPPPDPDSAQAILDRYRKGKR